MYGLPGLARHRFPSEGQDADLRSEDEGEMCVIVQDGLRAHPRQVLVSLLLLALMSMFATAP